MSTTAPSTAEYCRQIEAYLCRRNDGHLIRIVGPAFERVSAWAGQGIPLKVAFQGIDRYVDRQAGQQAKGPRRRPVRIEFCEADILDAFDQWRRAVGAVAGTGDASEPGATDTARGGTTASSASEPAPSSRRVALQAHIDRVMVRLTQRRLDADVTRAVGQAIDRTLSELDALRPHAHGARGEQRDRVKQQLRELDAALMGAIRAAWAAAELARLEAEARRDLQTFRERMPGPAFQQAVDAATLRLLRDAARVPQVAIDL